MTQSLEVFQQRSRRVRLRPSRDHISVFIFFGIIYVFNKIISLLIIISLSIMAFIYIKECLCHSFSTLFESWLQFHAQNLDGRFLNYLMDFSLSFDSLRDDKGVTYLNTGDAVPLRAKPEGGVSPSRS